MIHIFHFIYIYYTLVCVSFFFITSYNSENYSWTPKNNYIIGLDKIKYVCIITL